MYGSNSISFAGSDETSTLLNLEANLLFLSNAEGKPQASSFVQGSVHPDLRSKFAEFGEHFAGMSVPDL